MSSALAVFLDLQLRGGARVASGLSATQRQLRGLGDAGHTAFTRMGTALRGVNEALTRMPILARYATAAVALNEARKTISANLEFEKNLLEMKQTGEMSKAQSEQAKSRIMALSGSTLNTPQDLLAGMRSFTSAGERFEFAMAALEESGRAATAFFTTPEKIADMDVDLKQKMGITAGQLPSAHNMLLYHARAGRYETQAMAQDAPKTLTTMRGAGFTGTEGVNLMGAMTQQLMKLAPKTQPAEVATFMDHFLGHLVQPHYVEGMRRGGMSMDEKLDLTKKQQKFKTELHGYGIDIQKYMPGGFFGGADAKGNPLGGQKAVDDFFRLLNDMKAKGMTDPFKLGAAGFREMYTTKAALQLMREVETLVAEMKAGEGAAKTDLVGAAFKEIKEANFGKIKAAEIEVDKLRLGEVATQGTGGVANITKMVSEGTVPTLPGLISTMLTLNVMARKDRIERKERGEPEPNASVPGKPGVGANLAALFGEYVVNPMADVIKKIQALEREHDKPIPIDIKVRVENGQITAEAERRSNQEAKRH